LCATGHPCVLEATNAFLPPLIRSLSINILTVISGIACEMFITAVTVDSDHATGKGLRETSNNQQYYIPCDKKPRHRENKQMRGTHSYAKQT